MEALGFCAMAYPFLVIPVVSLRPRPPRPFARRQRARTVDGSRHWAI